VGDGPLRQLVDPQLEAGQARRLEPVDRQGAQCPVPRDMPIALSSPRRTLDGLLCAAAADDVIFSMIFPAVCMFVAIVMLAFVKPAQGTPAAATETV
jgi:hypothetical protein